MNTKQTTSYVPGEAPTFTELREQAAVYTVDDNIKRALAIAHVESERAMSVDHDMYYAWNKVIHQLWAIEEARVRGQGI